ncbi:hypothetical protein TrVE_jg1290 [Triparma verrucosa]|uniref:NADP-dependent oxidoreductase domain-containing protein n=1 Tax=Triparma verrucosa TaxID=1606542 RepID=A0A9W7BNE9_9STRA|nr:hypothetical protein TrVE_jg1290 [Triparma verrucosa]
MGLLTNNVQEWHPAGKILREKCRRAREYVKEKGMDMVRLALGYALSRKECGSVVMGMTEEWQVDLAVEVRDKGLTDEEWKVIEVLRNEERFFKNEEGWDGIEEVKKFWEGEV